MYRLMKEQTLTFIADLFINLQEQEISLHDEIAKSIDLLLIQKSRRLWIELSDPLGIAWSAKVSEAP